MNVRILTLTGLFAFASVAGPVAASEGSPVRAETNTDSKAYLAGIDQILQFAGQGVYGQLESGADNKLQAARQQIAQLLDGHASTAELQPEERAALFNAEKLIKSTAHSEDKSRKVCVRNPSVSADIGSRMRTVKKECATVAEREAAALARARKPAQ